MAYQLVMKTGPAPGRIYSLDKSEISIGREIGSDVFINEAEVSRRHARMTLQAGNYLLEDLGSTNGTFVNGQRLMGPRQLQPGDTILVGENASLSYEIAPFDPNATQVDVPEPAGVIQPESSPEPVPAPEVAYTPPMVEAYPPVTPPPQSTPYAGATYSPPPTPKPVEMEYPEEPRPSRRWLWAGCGCLVVLLCVLAGAAYIFDYLNLYCTPPFRDVMVIFGAACP
jgi:predicted component of type VI protein secretion system